MAYLTKELLSVARNAIVDAIYDEAFKLAYAALVEHGCEPHVATRVAGEVGREIALAWLKGE